VVAKAGLAAVAVPDAASRVAARTGLAAVAAPDAGPREVEPARVGALSAADASIDSALADHSTVARSAVRAFVARTLLDLAAPFAAVAPGRLAD